MAFDGGPRTRLHSTDPPERVNWARQLGASTERVNKEIERRTSVVGIFPDREPSSGWWAR